MSRIFTSFKTQEAQEQLEILANLKSDVAEYKKAMLKLGEELGKVLEKQIKNLNSKICLACTVEDADFLSKGIIDVLERNHEVALVCFWNNRVSQSGVESAPIIKRHKERLTKEFKHLIIVKSIISGSCVVRTNLTNLLGEISPEEIFVTAPVMFKDAENKLTAAFTKEIADKFQFIRFATDTEKSKDGNVYPGVGGDVYSRLGFLDQNEKNRYIPLIVKQRRETQNIHA